MQRQTDERLTCFSSAESGCYRPLVRPRGGFVEVVSRFRRTRTAGAEPVTSPRNRTEVGVRIEVIEGIGAANALALSGAGVTHVRHLLQRAATASGRDALARETGLSPDQLLEWLNHIDLMRIRGVGAEYSDLLEAAGVNSPVELARHSPARLASLLAQTNAQQPLVRRVPSEKVLAGWISEARTLPRLITH
jgi:predicted flap endonuclease-1-like 5' DNA nuclease